MVLSLMALPTAHAQQVFAPGAIVALEGTPHLWITDDQGVLHWAGDTRALQGRHVTWSDRREVTVDGLRALPKGDPWLSAGLLKDGDPIYLVKWETEWAQPRLLHIQSIADVELFGINGTNYGAFVLDRATWEARYGISVAGLERGVLPPAMSTAAPPPSTAGPNDCPDGQRWDYYRNTCVGDASAPPAEPSVPISTDCPDGQRWDYYKEICVVETPSLDDLVDPRLRPALDLVAAAYDTLGLDGAAITYDLILHLNMPVKFGGLRRGNAAFLYVASRTAPPRIIINETHRDESSRAIAPSLAHELLHAARYYLNQIDRTFEGCVAEEILAETAAAAIWSVVRPGAGVPLTDLEWTHEINYYDWLDGTLAAEVRDRYRVTCVA